MDNLKSEYKDAKKAKSIYYAMVNSGRIKEPNRRTKKL